jgi:hypothetical protein
MDAILDTAAKWTLKTFDRDDHDHCALTWETIMGSNRAYFNPRHGWITQEAYNHYIRDDALRVRGRGLRSEDC